MEKIEQIENIKYILNEYGAELWVQICGNAKLNGAKAFFWSGLLPLDKIELALENSEWEHNYGMKSPGFVQYGNDEIIYERPTTSEYEPLLYVRDYYGIKDSIIEISEEFRHLNNLYFDANENKYFAITESGDLDSVIKIEGENVYSKLNYLKRYASAKQMAIGLYFDIRFDNSKMLEEMNLKNSFEIKKVDNCVYDFQLNNNDHLFSENKKSYSVIHGKKLIIGGDISNSGYWPFESSKVYEDFIIGMDSDGCEIKFSSNNNRLANNFGANADSPHYLTPVYFSKDVLTKYYSKPDKYEVNDGHIRCQGLWLFQIDNHHDDYVTAYLGDLGRDLPHKEQIYWKSFNIVPDGGISMAKFKRDFMSQFTDPTIADLRFKQRFIKFKKDWNSKFDWDFFLQFSQADQYNFDHLRLPVANSQVEFDGQILSLVKTIIDSINEKKIGKLVKNNEEIRGGISKLERYLSEHEIDDYEKHIKFLRNLQDLRSTGSGHRKGKSYDKASSAFSLNENGFIETFKYILNEAYSLLEFLDEKFL